MAKIGFDNELYVKLQTKSILELLKKYDNKLYLEFGGKLFDDFHATRVLPGFQISSKIRVMQNLKDQMEIVFVISAAMIENNKVRSDIGISYGKDALRLMNEIRNMGICINNIVVTQYEEQQFADIYIKELREMGETVHIHRLTKGYPNNVDVIVSKQGYGANPYIQTTKPIVVVTASGPSSGKLATCFCQLYHEYQKGVKAGYAKFETFPIWDLGFEHPINIAYEAATIDISDSNFVDPLHVENNGMRAMNYNRDVEAYPVLRDILERILKDRSSYVSPTDMGVNSIRRAITDMDLVIESAVQEVLRRYYKILCDCKKYRTTGQAKERIKALLDIASIMPEQRLVVRPALIKGIMTKKPAMSIMVDSDVIITGAETGLMSSSASTVLEALKALSEIPDYESVIAPGILEPILKLKKELSKDNSQILDLSEVLMALSMSASINRLADLCLCKLPLLKDCDAHSTKILDKADEDMLKKLGIRITCEPVFRVSG